VAATSPEILVDQPGGPRVPKGQVAALTGLRGFAALVVVVVHASGLTDYPWIGIHGYGPIALFVLSGFLLFQPWSKWILGRGGQPVLSTFFKRRLLRIFPAYLVTLVIIALIYPASRPLDRDGWLRSLTLTQTTAYDGLRPGMEHVWSLNTELSWYVILPFLGAAAAAVVFKAGRSPGTAVAALLGAALCVTVAWRWFLAARVEGLAGLLTLPFWLPGFLVCFVAGAAVGHVVVADRYEPGRRRLLHRFAQHPMLVILSAIAAAGVATSSLGGPWGYEARTDQERLIRFWFCTLLALILLIGVAASDSRSVVNRAFSARWIVAVGRWSYGIYLWHLPVRELLAQDVSIGSGPAGFVVWLSLQLVVAIPLGAATYAFIEKPTIAWSKRERSGRHRPAQQPS
jgi:peptidoglycan/LPS O-acetylase OafA/YrhL